MGTELVFAQTQKKTEATALEPSFKGRFLRFGSFHVDLRREELFKDATRVRVPGKVYKVLVALLEQPGEIVTRESLRARLWPDGTHVNYDANVNTTVNKLRQVLGDSPGEPRYIETIPRQGYSFIGRMEESDTVPTIHLRGPRFSDTNESNETPKKSRVPMWFSWSAKTSGWLKAGAVALLITGMFLGAALVYYAYHAL